jgi:hypothetical protein
VNETIVAVDISKQRLRVSVLFSFWEMGTYGIQVIAPFELTENVMSFFGANFEGNLGSSTEGQPCYSLSKRMSVANATFRPPSQLPKTQSHYEIGMLLDLKATDLVSLREAGSAKSIIILGFFGGTPLDSGLIKCALKLGSVKETLNAPFRVEVQLPPGVLLAEDTFPPPNEIFRTERFNVASWSPNFMTRLGGTAQTIQVSYYSPTERHCSDIVGTVGLLVTSLGFAGLLESVFDWLRTKDKKKQEG